MGCEVRTEPWLTEGAIERIQGYLMSIWKPKVFEFGSGASTLWFRKLSDEVVSIEHDPAFALHLCTLLVKRPYGWIIRAYPDQYFDLILVDGRDRVDCVKEAHTKVKKGGLLVLDNSERTRYGEIPILLKSWKRADYYQTGKDKFGFIYPGWRTTIYENNGINTDRG